MSTAASLPAPPASQDARPHHLPPGRMGLRLAILSAAVGMAAVNTGNNLLYVMLSLALALAALSLLAARWALRHLSVTPRLPEEAVCGEPFLAGVQVRGRFPLLPQTWVEVRIDGLPGSVTMTVPVASSTGSGVGSSRVTLDRRGVFRELAVTASTGYPLDLLLSSRRAALPGALVVLPRFTRLSRLRVASPLRRRAVAEGRRSPRAGGTGGDLHDIREYTLSDDARHIDWRSSARTGRLMVREYEREQERRLDLVLDLQAARPEDLEPVIELCASILDFARHERFEARLFARGQEAGLTGRPAMRFLAEAQALPPGLSIGPLLRAARGAGGNGALVVLSADPARATPIEVS
ncbi:MAG TPA: DUF58 domain-containing protein [Candidatus Polarisedimenticolia bacterium]|nr:DUF58 domain-containing protein [Candidatus Polarisedimenticolia bacterium]